MAGIKNADNNLAQLRKALDDLGSPPRPTSSSPPTTASRRSQGEQDQPVGEDILRRYAEGFSPMGFLALDLAKALNLPLFDPNDKNARVADKAHPKAGNGVLGQDPTKPELVIATNGGSDLIYIPGKDRKFVDRTIKALLEQDYVSGSLSMTNSGASPARCRCRNSASRAKPSRRIRRSSSISAPGRRAARSRPTARCRLRTPCCARARACMAASRAAIR
jgi:hypothetical protein